MSLFLMPFIVLLLFAIIDYSHGELAIFIYIMLHIINMDAIFDLSLFAIFFNIFVCVILSESGDTHHIILLL